MATQAEMRLLKQRQNQLTQAGVKATLSFSSRPVAQWYKPDGTPLPNLLPADPHHIEAFERKGLTLMPRLFPK